MSKRKILVERSTDSGVFQDMDNFELNEAGKYALSIRLQFPKFSKGFSENDFETFVETHVGKDNLMAIGRLAFPNEWQMRVKYPEIREKLIRMGKTKINTRSCWISPLSQSEIRGYIHWLPNAITDQSLANLLEPFGEVLFMEIQKSHNWTLVDSDSRYFAMNLKPGRTMDDLPHFFKLEDHHGFITIRGRNPVCFHCRQAGHRKSECKKYREKLSEYCSRKPNTGQKRLKPRGKRYKSSLIEGEKQNAFSKNKKKKKSKASASQTQESIVKESGKNLSESNDLVASTSNKDPAMQVVNSLGNLDIGKNLEFLQTLTACLSTLAEKNKIASTTTSASDNDVQSKPSCSTSVSTGNVPAQTEQSFGEVKSKSKKKKKKKKNPKVITEANS